MNTKLGLALVVSSLLGLSGCGGGGSAPSTGPVGDPTTTPKPTFSVAPANVSVTEGERATFNYRVLDATSCQWQELVAGTTWTDLSGQTADVLEQANVPLQSHGATFRAVCTGTGGSTVSAAASISVNPRVPLRIVTQPAIGSVLEGSDATLAVEATGAGLAYVWQRWDTNVTDWRAITGANQASLVLAHVSSSDNGALFRVEVRAGAASQMSAPVTLVVDALQVETPQFTSEPIDTAVLAGGTLSMTANAAAQHTPEITWQRSTDGGVQWVDIGIASSQLSVPGIEPSANGSLFRAVARNAVYRTPVAQSRAARLTVIARPSLVVPQIVFGRLGGQGHRDGLGVKARFEYGSSTAVDRLGNIFVAETEGGSIRKVTPSGQVSGDVPLAVEP